MPTRAVRKGCTMTRKGKAIMEQTSMKTLHLCQPKLLLHDGAAAAVGADQGAMADTATVVIMDVTTGATMEAVTMGDTTIHKTIAVMEKVRRKKERRTKVKILPRKDPIANRKDQTTPT